MSATRDRVRGGLLGLAVGDGLGGRFVGQPAEVIRACFPTVSLLVNDAVDALRPGRDTGVSLAVAEALAECGEVCADRLAQPKTEAARAVPVGLFFNADAARVDEQARRVGGEAARLLALAVALAVRTERLDRAAFLGRLIEACACDEYRTKLERAKGVRKREELAAIGGVVTALASFAWRPESYADAVGSVIVLGGDTAALGALAGALAGAYLGAAGLPPRLVALLDGRENVVDLATRLHARLAVISSRRDPCPASPSSSPSRPSR